MLEQPVRKRGIADRERIEVSARNSFLVKVPVARQPKAASRIDEGTQADAIHAGEIVAIFDADLGVPRFERIVETPELVGRRGVVGILGDKALVVSLVGITGKTNSRRADG